MPFLKSLFRGPRNYAGGVMLFVSLLEIVSLISLLESDVHAQVVQPVYVRPENAPSVLVYPGTGNTGLPANTTNSISAVTDSSKFGAVQIYLDARNTGGGSCTSTFSTVSLLVEGSFSKTGPFFALSDQFAAFTLTPFGSSNDTSYAVGSLPNWIRFTATTGTNADSTCRLLVNMILIPFSTITTPQGRAADGSTAVTVTYPVVVGGIYQGPSLVTDRRVESLKSDLFRRLAVNVERTAIAALPVGSPMPIPTGTNTTVWTFGQTLSAPTQYLYIQNVGTEPIVCAYGVTNGGTGAQNLSATRYEFGLKAATSTTDFDGGERYIDVAPTSVALGDAWSLLCRSVGGGAGSLAFFPY